MGGCGVDELQEEATNKSVGVNWKKEYSLRGMRYFFYFFGLASFLSSFLLLVCCFVVGYFDLVVVVVVTRTRDTSSLVSMHLSGFDL
jgi:hypothetical protein